MSDTKIKTSNIGNLAVTHALLHTDMDLTSKTVQVATPTSNTHPATKAYVDTEVANLIDSAPGTLDTLNELAAAINDDANFNATIASSIATKLPLAGGTLTGNLTLASTASGSSASPELELRRDITGADANYLGQIKFTADNDADQNVVFAKITGKILDASDGTEDGIIEFAHKKAGSNNISARFRSDSLQLINGTNLTVAGTTELTGNLTVDTSTLHVDTSNNKVGIGTTSPDVKFEVQDDSTWDTANFTSSSTVGAGLTLAATDTGTRWSLIAQGTTGGGNDNNLGFHLTNAGTSGEGAGYKFVMTPSGRLGIGTSSPSTQLEVKGSTYSLIRVNGGNTNNAGIDFGDTDDVDIGRIRYDNSSDAMQFWTNNAERMRIDSSGNVGINASDPQGSIHVRRTGTASLILEGDTNNSGDTGQRDVEILMLTDGGAGNDPFGGTTYGAHGYRISTQNLSGQTAFSLDEWHSSQGFLSRFHIDSTGNVGIGTTTPGAKLDISSTGISTSPTINITTTTSSAYTHAINAFAPNLTASQGNILVIGRAGSTNNSGYIGYKYSGTPGSDDNLVSLGHWGNNWLLNVKGNGNVGIGTENPAEKLEVNGSIKVGNLKIQNEYGGRIGFNRNTANGAIYDSSYAAFQINGATSTLDYLSFEAYPVSGSASNAMCIKSNGNVGIGTSSPNQLLEVSGNGAKSRFMRSGSAGTTVEFFSGASQAGGIQVQSTGLGIAGGARENDIFIDTSGNVNVSKTSVNIGTTGHTFGASGYQHSTRNGNLIHLNQLDADGSAILFMQAGATKGSVFVNSTSTTYNTTSDRRLKENIEPISNATDKLMDMKPVTHTWIDNPEAPQVHGFIAQEMQEVVPEAVSGDAESDEMMSMDYGRITPVIVAALQDALKEIKELKTRIDELESK